MKPYYHQLAAREKFVQLYNQGWSNRELIAEMKISRRTLHRWLHWMRQQHTSEQPLTTKASYTTAEAARRLGFSRQGVKNWIQRRQLPATKIGKVYWIAASDLKDFVPPCQRPIAPTTLKVKMWRCKQ